MSKKVKKLKKEKEFEFSCILGVYKKKLTSLKECCNCPLGGDLFNYCLASSPLKRKCPVWELIHLEWAKENTVHGTVWCPKTECYTHIYNCWHGCTKSRRASCKTEVFIRSAELEKKVDRKQFCNELEKNIMKKAPELKKLAKEMDWYDEQLIASEIENYSRRIAQREENSNPKPQEEISRKNGNNDNVSESTSKSKKRKDSISGNSPKTKDLFRAEQRRRKFIESTQRRCKKSEAEKEATTIKTEGEPPKRKRGRPPKHDNQKKSN